MRNVVLIGMILAVAANAQKLNCRPEYTRLSGIIGTQEAAQAIGMRNLAEHGVESELRKLRGEARYAGVSEHGLRDIATGNVRERLQPDQRERFDRAALELQGRRDFARVLEVFKDPSKHLGVAGTETTPLEDRLLSAAAFKFATEKGVDTANASHLADHVAAVKDPRIAALLNSLGLREGALVRNILTHDLGKEYGQLPASFRAFLESIYPLPKAGEKDVNYLPRVIMSHEFGSMIATERLAREAGIPEEKIPRLLALFAHHNAGYDPKLPGNHFWVQPFAWKAFADALNTQGLDVPTVYDAVLGTSKGGNPETILLTAIDRATSLTLASQEKFTPVRVTRGEFNNVGMPALFREVAENTALEVKDVLSKLEGRSTAENEQYGRLTKAVLDFYEPDTKRLEQLGREMPMMAKGEGAYANRPSTTEDQLKSSVLYKTKDGTWHMVTSDGKLYQTKTNDWGNPVFTPAAGHNPDPAGLLFRRVINPEFGYTPRALPADLVK